ncbi:MAG: acyl-homoserine-lactone synthase [Variovorax sp.]
MEILAGTSSILSSGVMSGVARYRHKVFIEKLGWELACQEGLEYDQFDRDDTIYVVARSASDSVIGIARLLPTSRPYLLGDVFPKLMGGLPLPNSDSIWELSRFAAVDFDSTAKSSPMAQFSSPLAIGLLRETIALAARSGAKRLIAVTHLGVERLLRRAGFVAHRAAPPLIIDGQPLFACWIEVPAASNAEIAASQPENASYLPREMERELVTEFDSATCSGDAPAYLN